MYVRGVRAAMGLMLTLLMVLLAAMPASAVQRADDAPAAGGGEDFAFVRFHGEPLASYDGSLAGYEATRPGRGQKLNLQSEAARKYGRRLEAQRENYKKWLTKHYPEVEIVAEYAVTFNGLGLKLNGADLRAISAGPGTAEAHLSAIYRPAMNSSTALINAQAIWTHMGGQAEAGAGMKVGVIDSGIDASHPFLRDDGMSLPEGYPLGDERFTSNKVIVAKVFHQSPWHTAEAVNSHGTHVAGTIGGRAGTNAPLAGNLSGVAPGVWLGNYNVFPGATGSASSLFIAKAVEEAVADGMDVLNLSLGGTAHRGRDLLDMAVNAAADAGVVVAIAASNDGPGFFTVGSPGTAENVITVAATTNSRTFAMFLESVALADRTLATTGTQGGEVKASMTGTYEVWADHAGGDPLACTPLSGTPMDGMVALIQRGACTFTTKINNAAAAGAKAVIIYQSDSVAGEPIPMSSDGALIPAVMIGRDAGYALAAWTGDRTITVNYPPEEVAVMPNALADFSSWGPTPNYMLKPDLAAPGVNIYSSVVGGGFEVYQGTSMATPHVAGAAALLLAHSQANGLNWGPAEVKAALMATAHDAAMGHDPLTAGAGIIDLAAAMSPSAMAMPSSLSYGLVRPVGNHSYQMTFTLSNPTAAEQTYTLAESMGRLALSATEVTLGAGESASITAEVVYRGTQAPGHHEHEFVRGYISATDAAGTAIRIPYLYVVDYNR